MNKALFPSSSRYRRMLVNAAGTECVIGTS